MQFGSSPFAGVVISNKDCEINIQSTHTEREQCYSSSLILSFIVILADVAHLSSLIGLLLKWKDT